MRRRTTILTVNDIINKEGQIEEILARYRIPKQDCKFFGQIIGQFFPVSAHAHFLVKPAKDINSQEWGKLQQEIKALFSSFYLGFYTEETLDNMVKFYGLNPDYAKLAKQNAIPLDNLAAACQTIGEKRGGLFATQGSELAHTQESATEANSRTHSFSR